MGVVFTLATRQIRGLISTPIEFLPKSLDSTNVVPLPTKLSKIRSFGFERRRIKLRGICGMYFEG